MAKKTVVSIVIVHYHVKDELFACLTSLQTSFVRQQAEVIVIDNDEKQTIEKQLRNRFPHVRYIKTEKNLGYGGGNNIGASLAKGEFLLFLNPDTIVEKSCIEELVTFMQKKKDAGIVAPLLLDQKKNPYKLQGTQKLTPLRAIFALSFFHKLFPNNTIAKSYWHAKWDKKSVQEVDVIPGTALLIRKDVFEKASGFDEKFFLFFEENDLCEKVRGLGLHIYFQPSAKVIHIWGKSTEKAKNINAIFAQSRFYYFHKFYGLFTALFVEGILRLQKKTIILFGILLLSLFLNIYLLDTSMLFIGDFAWFYLSARDMIIHRTIPLVGITASHTWLHQGAFWTYIVAPLLLFGNFNPVLPAYFTAILGVVSVWFMYKIASTLFSSRVGIIAAFLYATSPLVIEHARIPYHTSPIPFFTLLFLYSMYQWISGNIKLFLLILFLLACLYNFEIATAILWPVVVLFFIYGFIKKERWVMDIFQKKIIIFSFISLFLPLIPFFIYDVTHEFSQIGKFVVWVGYKIALFFGFPRITPDLSPSYSSLFQFSSLQITKLIYLPSTLIAMLLFIVSILFAMYEAITTRQKGIILLLIALCVSLLGFFAAKTISAAYLLQFFPLVILSVAVFINFLTKKTGKAGYIIFILIIVGNIVSLFSVKEVYTKNEFNKKIIFAKRIIVLTNRMDYVFVPERKEYEYLTWWLGHGPSQNAKRKVTIDEARGKIRIQ